jgi:hypothetical protein
VKTKICWDFAHALLPSRISSLASGRGGPRYCGGQQSGLKKRLSSPTGRSRSRSVSCLVSRQQAASAEKNLLGFRVSCTRFYLLLELAAISSLASGRGAGRTALLRRAAKRIKKAAVVPYSMPNAACRTPEQEQGIIARPSRSKILRCGVWLGCVSRWRCMRALELTGRKVHRSSLEEPVQLVLQLLRGHLMSSACPLRARVRPPP